MTEKNKFNDDNLLAPEFLEQLKKERLARGISVAEVAEKTNIREIYIDAIENGEFHRLPGGVYNKAYVRSVSEFLGIRPSISQIVKDNGPVETGPIKLPDIDPTRYEIIPNKLIIVGAVAGLIFIYGIYAAITKQKPSEIKAEEQKTEQVAATTTDAEKTDAETVEPVAAEPTKLSHDITISVVAIGNSKVKITSESGEIILDKPMKYGETKIFAGVDNLKMIVDAPQNIEVYLNGTYAGSTSIFPLVTGTKDTVLLQVSEILKKITKN